MSTVRTPPALSPCSRIRAVSPFQRLIRALLQAPTRAVTLVKRSEKLFAAGNRNQVLTTLSEQAVDSAEPNVAGKSPRLDPRLAA
jgi:hypothetical protein